MNFPNMNKGIIAERQNTKVNLEKLAAAEQLYTGAKKIKTFQVLLSVVIPIAITLLKKYYEKSDNLILWRFSWGEIYPYLSLLSVVITFLNLYLFKYWLSTKIKTAAYLQYIFDSNILSIEKNIFLDVATPHEEIKKYSSKRFKKKTIEKFENWYTAEISNADLTIGRFICLRSNYVWDLRLRKFHRNGIVFTFSILLAIIIVPAIYNEATLKDFIVETIITLLPLITLCLTEIFDNNKTIKKKETGLTIINGVWKRFLEKKISKSELDKFFKECLESLHNLRLENPLIANWEHKLLRNSNEDQMQYGAEGMLKEYKESIMK
jgi:hypothetical protein